MAKKRRTKKQKAAAKHTFVTWQKTSEFSSGTTPVKGQKKIVPKSASKKQLAIKNAYLSGSNTQLAHIKKDLLKSLVLFSLIASVEVMLYFLWA